MNNQINTPSISTDDIIIKITGQDMIDMGYYIGEDLPEQKFNLHIDISEQKIEIAPDVDGGSFDPTYEFEYAETLSDLSAYEHLPNTICGGIEYWYNDGCTESSSSCNPSEIASICGISDDELAAFNSLDHLNSFFTLGGFSFTYEPEYIYPEAILKDMEKIDIHIDMDAKKITCFNSRKGIYETISFVEACLEDTMDKSDLQEYFEDCYPHHSVNVIFL
jgi:hypothetical protein